MGPMSRSLTGHRGKTLPQITKGFSDPGAMRGNGSFFMGVAFPVKCNFVLIFLQDRVFQESIDLFSGPEGLYG